MTLAELKAAVNATGSHFFDRDAMDFFGDTTPNYVVSTYPVLVRTSSGEHQAWELRRKQPVKHGLQKAAYFAVGTFARLHPIEGDTPTT